MSHKASKALLLSSAIIAEWSWFQPDSHTARVQVSLAAKHLGQMHAKINIFFTVLVPNIENGKLHRQVDSVDAGLNRDSQ